MASPLAPLPGGTTTTLNVTAPAIIKASPGRVFTVSVIVQGSSTYGAVYDSNSLSGNTTANQIGVIANTTNPIDFNAMPTATGIVVAPGAGQTLTVSWS